MNGEETHKIYNNIEKNTNQRMAYEVVVVHGAQDQVRLKKGSEINIAGITAMFEKASGPV